MSPAPGSPATRRISILLTGEMLRALVPAGRTTLLTLAELSLPVFFISGVAFADLGAAAPWLVVAAVVLGILARASDIESWALFIPGGLAGRVNQAFGARAAVGTTVAVIVERLLFIALAALIASRAVLTAVVALFGRTTRPGGAPAEDLAALMAAALVGTLWLRARTGYSLTTTALVRWMGFPLAVVTVLTVWGAATGNLHTEIIQRSLVEPAPSAGWLANLPVGWAVWLIGLGLVMSGTGSGTGLTRLTSELAAPRLQGLRRLWALSSGFNFFVIVSTAFLFSALVAADVRAQWIDAPILALSRFLPAPMGLRWALILAAGIATLLVAAYAAQVGLHDAESALQRLSRIGIFGSALRETHPRYGTPTRLTDVSAAIIVLLIVASSGRVAWLATAYGVAVAWTILIGLVALRRLRATRAKAASESAPTAETAVRTPTAVHYVVGGALGLGVLAMLVTGSAGAWAVTAMIWAGGFLAASRHRDLAAEPDDLESFQVLQAANLAVGHVEARPGNILVGVRHPFSLVHLAAALRQSGDRDVVVMTARLIGRDVEDEAAETREPTADERLLFSQVIALAERYGKAVRLLIVPARSVFEAAIAAVLNLRSSEMYVGESATLSAEEQARQLGEAWEHAEKPAQTNVRLVIHHRSGRTHSYFLGAHAPALTPADLDLIHRLWLDVAKAVGPHVHHHDIVRAALTQMAQQLDGPGRQSAVDTIRQVSRPADEIAAAVRSRDFSRLREMMRNRPPEDVADMLGRLAIEDQVVVFRLLPRKDAAETFEYLIPDTQTALLKAMAQEDVAALLNEMAPDDRTMFLEELPASATRQLLSLLTPEERAVALTLLGYPEGSIGRLMTPQYVRVREDWTVQQVLDHIREHGEDSETLNVIYVVDEKGALIDDLRIRELLLASPGKLVADLLDRRFVSLKATDDQETAIAIFRQHDRVALPVTDTSGILIGIVTIDDVLHVAEEVATAEIQRIGGSEALDEPYMRSTFVHVVRKRAGWLTALFLGEMLTATAMGVFEEELRRAVVLAMFVPLIISSGGNSGSQASTLVIRALALGEVTLGDWWKVAKREVFTGLALGSILGIIGILRIGVWSAFSGTYGEHWLGIGMTVGVTVLFVVMWGTITGSMLPFIMRRLGFDPATSSAPFIATLVDVTGLIIYFSVALLFLGGTLL
jgi:magnesium transporter